MFKSIEGGLSWIRIMSTYVILHTMFTWTYTMIFVTHKYQSLSYEEVSLILGSLGIKGLQRFAEKKR